MILVGFLLVGSASGAYPLAIGGLESRTVHSGETISLGNLRVQFHISFDSTVRDVWVDIYRACNITGFDEQGQLITCPTYAHVLEKRYLSNGSITFTVDFSILNRYVYGFTSWSFLKDIQVSAWTNTFVVNISPHIFGDGWQSTIVFKVEVQPNAAAVPTSITADSSEVPIQSPANTPKTTDPLINPPLPSSQSAPEPNNSVAGSNTYNTVDMVTAARLFGFESQSSYSVLALGFGCIIIGGILFLRRKKEKA